MRPWILEEVNYAQLKAELPEVLLLPLGATEPHNLHLPYATDTLEARTIGEMACRKAYEKGGKVMLLPTIPFGTETNQREFPLSLNLMPSTILLIIKDLLKGLEHNGIRKLVFLNSHGGNEIKPMLRELYGQTSIQLFLCEWYRGLASEIKNSIFTHPDDHAGEIETSIIMAYFPELVNRDKTGKYVADEGEIQTSKLAAINEGWISITRPWHLATTNSGAGNPHLATAEKGTKFVEHITDRLADFLLELANLPLSDKFPY